MVLFLQLYFRTTVLCVFSVNTLLFSHVVSLSSGISVSNERFFFLLMTTFLVFKNVCTNNLHFMNLLVQMSKCFTSLLNSAFREIISSFIPSTYKFM